MQTPEPLLPPEVDLRDFAFMPLDAQRLRDSSLAATGTGDEFRAAVLLWCASWHQVPCASLPDDDALLAQYAGYGRVVREWRKVREGALRGWVKCSDGRFYHPVVAEKALESWGKKQEIGKRRAEERQRKKVAREPGCPPDVRRMSAAASAGQTPMSAGIPPENALKGRDRDITSANALGADAPQIRDPVKDMWNRGANLVGSQNRSVLGKMAKQYGPVVLMEAIIETEAERPVEPLDFLIGCCKRRKGNGRHDRSATDALAHDRAVDILGQAARDHDLRKGGSGDPQAPDRPAWGAEELGDGGPALH